MPDFGGAPVAQNVNPLGQGMQTLSDVMNFKRGQQALQTGVFQQESAQAEAQQQQQTARQRAGLANFMQSFDPTKHVGSDGTLDLDEVLTDPKLRAAAGDQFPALMQQLVQVKQTQLGAKKQLADLNGTLRDQFSSTVGSLRTDPDVVSDNSVGRQKVQQALSDFAESGGQDAARVAQIYGQVISHAPQGKLTQVLSNFQLQAMDAATQAGKQGPGLTDTGGELVNTNPQAAGGNLAGTTPIKKTLSPTDQPDYKQKAAAAAAAGASRASGVASSDVDRANQVSANIKPSQAGIQTTQQIDDLADQIHSGKFAGWLSKQAAAAGVQESTYARQLLEKDLGIIRTQLTSAAPSDSRAATILSGTPEATSDPQTIHGAMDYVRGSLRQNLAQGKNLEDYRAKHPDLSGFQGADDAFTSTGSPLVHEFLSLKGKEAQAAFYRRNFSNPEQALEFRNRTRAASHTLGLDNDNR